MQKQEVLEYLKRHGTITHLEAEQRLGCCRVAARVCELRKLGHQIDSEREGNGSKSWVRYRLG